MYVFEEFEHGLWTVGFYRPDGTFVPDSDHGERNEAAWRVSYLNGNRVPDRIPLTATPLHIRILSRGGLIADLPDWPYPLPQVGQYFFHPPQHGSEDIGGNTAGHVKTITWRMYDRPEKPVGSFVPAAHPYVEITI